MGFEINGFDELINHLSNIENNVSNLSKTDSLSFDEIFTSDFMSKHTNCKSFENLVIQIVALLQVLLLKIFQMMIGIPMFHSIQALHLGKK